jgi:DNA-binding transcriptional regulator LsrR (DeoR family)
MLSVKDLDPEILLLACELFFQEKRPAQSISDAVEAELRRTHREFEMTREKVYELIREARRRGYFQLLPPQEASLRGRLVARYGEGFHVVHMTELDHLAAAAAEVVAELIERLRREGREEVHLGLGAGVTSMKVARHLALRLRAADRLPALFFHALTSGFNATEPHTAPVSFFGFFDALPTETHYVGLFAPAFVRTRDWSGMLAGPGVRESFDRRGQIDIVLSALGSPSHGHGDFFRFMETGSKRGLETLLHAGWVGDVQYRPYSKRDPLLTDAEVRAVTLFELRDLVEMAGRPEDKHVVLVAGPCSVPGCGRTRTEAILPLLVEPSLKLWTSIVTDVTTAHELLELPPPVRSG